MYLVDPKVISWTYPWPKTRVAEKRATEAAREKRERIANIEWVLLLWLARPEAFYTPSSTTARAPDPAHIHASLSPSSGDNAPPGQPFPRLIPLRINRVANTLCIGACDRLRSHIEGRSGRNLPHHGDSIAEQYPRAAVTVRYTGCRRNGCF